mgnify:CR=1 FL=1
MKARVDKDTCIGCGLCPSICPEVFELDDDGYAKTIKNEIKDEEKDEVIEASEGCPTSAIEVKIDQE